jgi:three-Cys-motif partner protein
MPVPLHMEPHTKAKHTVLTEYLKAWFPILTTWDNRVIYLDGFAGCGEYDDADHSIGSPQIAIDTALNHILFKSKLSKKELVFWFIEKESASIDHLEQRLGSRYGNKTTNGYSRLPSNWSVDATPGEFSKVAGPLVSGLEQKGANLAPTLAFVDPFGYKDLDRDLMGRILRFPKCELLVTYMTGFMDRFSYDASHEDSIKATLGIDDNVLASIRAIATREERDLEWLRLLNNGIVTAAERQAAAASTPLPRIMRLSFKLSDQSNNVLFYLVYFTKNLVGIDVMKGAMYRASRDWSYAFSDYNFVPDQTQLFDYTDEKAWLKDAAEVVYSKFKGRKLVSFPEIRDFVRDPEVRYYFRTGILDVLQDDGRIVVHRGNRKKNSYPEDCLIDFS